MTILESEVLRILKTRRGRNMALKAKTIAEMLNGEEREIEQAISNLIELYGCPLGVIGGAARSYYWPEPAMRRR